MKGTSGKKNAVYGGVILLILLAVFNVVAFVVPHVQGGTFWTGYAFTTAAFLLQILFAFLAFGKADTLYRTFLGIPVFRLGIVYLVIQVIFGLVCLFVPLLPMWIAVVVSIVLLGFYLIMIITAMMARDEVEKTGNKVKEQTSFIRSLTVDAENLLARAKSDVAKVEAKKVYEAVRYSDPMSSGALSSVETQITMKFAAFSAAVESDEAEAVKAAGEELLILIGDRNRKCKALK